MRVMALVIGDAAREGAPPSEKMMTEMGAFNDELVKAGVMLSGDGLHPSAKGARVVFSGSERKVIDGPFTESKELVAGYWIWQVKSFDEALEWAQRIPNPDGDDGIVELRPLYEAEDFG